MERVVRNRAQCLECGMILESKHVHDWVHCRCDKGGIFVDGGREYLRRGGDLDMIRELAETEEVPTPVPPWEMPKNVREVNRRIARALEA